MFIAALRCCRPSLDSSASRNTVVAGPAGWSATTGNNFGKPAGAFRATATAPAPDSCRVLSAGDGAASEDCAAARSSESASSRPDNRAITAPSTMAVTASRKMASMAKVRMLTILAQTSEH